MSISSWFPWRLAQQHNRRSRPSQSWGLRRRGTRLACEQLEDRTVPSSFTAATVSDLIADINAANALGGSNTITLVAGNTFTLTARVQGFGLPAIAANNNLTIQGNGDTIERSTASGIPTFGLFNVAPGASLTLANVTLQGGYTARGGAVFNQGALDLKGVTVQNNVAYFGAGGGIYSSGSLTLEAGTIISGNQVIGPRGGYSWNGYQYVSYPGGAGLGGAVYVAGGTTTVTNVTMSANSAQGGWGAAGGSGEGGGLYVAGGTVTLTNTTLSSNSAQGGDAIPSPISIWDGGPGGLGAGGGLYVAGGTVSLSNDTLSSNSAVGGNSTGRFWAGAIATGGGLDAAGGTVTLRYVTVTQNSVQGGSNGRNGKKSPASGGGLYIDPTASLYLDAFTLKNTRSNTGGNIYGSYVLII
jgi:predicted outer membrane repeat protein